MLSAPLLRPGFGVRRRPRGITAALRPFRPRQVHASNPAASSRTCPAIRRAQPSSPTRATTKTSILAGLQVAFLLVSQPSPLTSFGSQHLSWARDQVFDEARRQTTWHYQWMIVHEFLPQIVSQAMVADVVANGCRFYVPAIRSKQASRWSSRSFTVFGHSMVRPSYRPTSQAMPASRSLRWCSSASQAWASRALICAAASAAPAGSSDGQTFFRFPGFEGDVTAQ